MTNLPARGRSISPGFLLLPIMLIALALCYFNLSPDVVGLYHDDGIYVVTAKAMATGQGYRIISLPNPLPQTKYPFFYSYLLSLIWRIYPHFPANVLPMKLLSVVASLLFFCVSYRFLTRFQYASPTVALGLIAMSAWCAWTIYYSTMVLSEMPYAFLSVSTLYLVEAARCRSTERARNFFIIAAGVLAGITYLTRSIGLMLTAGILAYLLYRRDGRRSSLFALIVSAIILPWVLWTRILAPPPGLSPMELYYVNYAHWISSFAGGYFSVAMLNVFCKNLLYCLSGVITLSNPVFVYAPLPVAFTTHAGIEAISVVAGLGLAGIGIWAALHYLRFRPRLLDAYLFFYVGSVLLWPWPPLRFLIPVAPFLILYNVRLMQWLTDLVVSRLPGPRVQRLIEVLVTGFAASGLLLNLALSVTFVRDTWTYGFSFPPAAKHRGYTWESSNAAALQWILRNTPPDATLSAVFDPMYYLYTGRRAVRGFVINPVESFYAAEHSKFSISQPREVLDIWRRFHVNYIVLIPNAEPLLTTYLKNILMRHPQWLSLCYMTPGESVIIFRLNHAALPSRGSVGP